MIVEALLIGLAAWRLANLLVEESGPFDIFEHIRRIAGIREGPVEGFFPLLLSCMYCTSVWTAVFTYLLWQIDPIIVVVIAAAALALLADSVIKIEK